MTRPTEISPVPESVPLPRLLARALTLCSGVPPMPEGGTPSLSSGGKGRRTVTGVYRQSYSGPLLES